eukprot:TRINITY_DN60267_c0_g1_i1.p1 TRINITY_DN60267_c0_g1~~TRINITY_DN60267_c0_g1_i1.p1  ORF type:complete len:412 (+),score=92.71 TRINITY_DN60267_c0_g1_i1:72-1307(+)
MAAGEGSPAKRARVDSAAARVDSATASPVASVGRTCRRRECGGEIGDAARVEVAVNLSEDGAPAGGLVSWAADCALPFHRDCWQKVLHGQAAGAERGLLRLAAQTAEHFDSAEELEAKARQAADILRSRQRTVAFTGAGLSTSAGLGDYRGKRGKWTLEAQGSSLPYTTEYEALRPTFAHEAVAKLVEMGRIGYVVSQNADGLHHLSGVPYTQLSDVHGSAFTECCPGCSQRYVRQTYAPEDRAEDYFAGRIPGPVPEHIKMCRGCGSNHWTGRKCDSCGGPLRDTVISFGDGLESCVLRPAFEYAQRADCCLSLGSTMSIGPSNQVVTMHSGPLIVCVRQETEMDELCKRSGGVRAFGDCDDFMRHLMRALLGEEEFAKWTASLPDKAAVYDSQRPTRGKKRGDIFVKKW